MISGVPRSVLSKNSYKWIHRYIYTHTCEFIYEFIYEYIFMNSYTNSHMNSYMNWYMWIIKIWIHNILCHLRNLQPPQHVRKVPLIPAHLHVSVCQLELSVARVFGAWVCAVIVLSTWAFVAWVFGGWSFVGYCQGVTRYRIAYQAPADTAKAW